MCRGVCGVRACGEREREARVLHLLCVGVCGVWRVGMCEREREQEREKRARIRECVMCVFVCAVYVCVRERG